MKTSVQAFLIVLLLFAQPVASHAQNVFLGDVRGVTRCDHGAQQRERGQGVWQRATQGVGGGDGEGQI